MEEQQAGLESGLSIVLPFVELHVSGCGLNIKRVALLEVEEDRCVKTLYFLHFKR